MKELIELLIENGIENGVSSDGHVSTYLPGWEEKFAISFTPGFCNLDECEQIVIILSEMPRFETVFMLRVPRKMFALGLRFAQTAAKEYSTVCT
ncbi:hypothetical protein H6G91_17130 [Nostoc muscorum FACHB-395]|nr:hypothetical protein [Desmonostoc muscorum FACHB-395]